ncbi:MAG: S8 family serine peptidase [Polyangiaceae bacterium]|nr:S8 family serine peptidase [Polyangiaceae bacterium]
MRRILNAHSRPLAPRWLLLGGVAALAATTNNGCSAAGAEHRTHGTQSANLEWLPAAPPRDLTHAPFLLGHSEPDPNRMVQVYVLLSEPAPAASIPRGIDLKSNSFNAQRSKQSFMRQAATVRAQQDRVVPQLQSYGAEIIARIGKVGNRVHVRIAASKVRDLQRVAEVVGIAPVPYYSRNLASAVPAIGAPKVWERISPLDGDGITIGVMDSGIDYTHADFGGTGTSAAYNANDSAVIEANSFPTARVVGGKDFAGDAYDGSTSPKPDPDPLDCARQVGGRISGGHGTHVAGIAAGNGVLKDGSPYTGPYNASLDPNAFEVYPGVAPKASLHAIRIFGCDGGTTLTANAYDYAIDPNGDDDPSDRLDVLNASLGSDFGLGGSNAALIKNLVRGGTVFVAAAGNAGSSYFIAGQPAGVDQALSVAATSESALPELKVTSPASVAGSYAAVSGGISAPIPTDTPISGKLVRTQPSNGCADYSNAAAISGNIALIDRGSCTFEEKLSRAAAAGAVAAVVVQNSPAEPPFPMGGDNPVGIPAVMIGNSDGGLLKGASNVEADLLAVEGKSQLSPFSSRGPESTTGGFKPEIAAPGGDIRSAGVGSGYKGVVNSGTSMASPMAAGAAALVRQAHPTWLPTEVKSAMINTAAPAFVSGMQAPVSHVGGGRVQVDAAIDTQVVAAAEPSEGSGIAFGFLITESPTTSARTVRITNTSSSSVEFDVASELQYPVAGVSVTASQSSVSIPAGESFDLEVALTFDPTQVTTLAPDPTTPTTVRLGSDAEYGRHFLMEAAGQVNLTSKTTGQPDLHVPFNGAVRPAGSRSLDFGTCGEGNTLTLESAGGNTTPAPVTGVFQLGLSEDPETTLDASDDVIAIGAATDLKSRDFADASAFIALAIRGTWTTPAPNSYETFSSGSPGRYVVQIDTNLDNSYDYELVALSFNDVLICYSMSRTGQQGGGRFLNIVPADVLNTNAYLNSVLVFPVFLDDLGLTAENAKFQYRVSSVTGSIINQGDTTPWATFDANHPAVDASPYGLDGRPLFSGDDVIRADVDRNQPAQALILHFDNIEGQRAQVIDVPAPGTDESNLVLTSSTVEKATAGSNVQSQLTIAHVAAGGSTTPRQVSLKLGVSGLSLLDAVPSVGSCNAAARTCDLGELAPGESATIDLTLRALEGETEGTVTAEIGSDEGCGASADDDSISDSVTIEQLQASDPNQVPAVSPGGGGCSCRTARNSSAPSNAASWLGLGIGLAWLRRRRQRRTA